MMPNAECQMPNAELKRRKGAAMGNSDLRERTKSFALRVIKLVDALPNTLAGRKIGDQLLRAGTAVGANYRAACRGRSKREFVAKVGIVEEEADESAYWMELIMAAELLKSASVLPLHDEAEQICRIMAKSRITAGRSLRSA
jgi:four helix bundle protein